MKKIIIIGATSGIGRGLAEVFANENCKVGIVGRRENLLNELFTQNKGVFSYKVADITQTGDTISKLELMCEEIGGMDMLIISSGTGEINPALDYSLEEPTLLTNVIGFTNVIDWGFNYFRQQGSGHLVVISSIAGLRGGGEAPAYNASKAYQINYTEGLRQKVSKLRMPIYLTDVRPGFVDTAMAKGEGLFWVAPLDKAVKQIVKAIKSKKKVVYVSKRWRYVSAILKSLPSAIYCRM